MGTSRKIAIYKALIESKLLYSLACLCLPAAERRRLDGFQNRCLRSILGILPAYVSRISHADVLQRSKCRPATDMILQRQVLLFGKALRAASDHPLNQSAFIKRTTEPATNKKNPEELADRDVSGCPKLGTGVTRWSEETKCCPDSYRIHLSGKERSNTSGLSTRRPAYDWENERQGRIIKRPELKRHPNGQKQEPDKTEGIRGKKGKLATKWNGGYFNCMLPAAVPFVHLKHMANSVACASMFASSRNISFLSLYFSSWWFLRLVVTCYNMLINML